MIKHLCDYLKMSADGARPIYRDIRACSSPGVTSQEVEESILKAPTAFYTRPTKQKLKPALSNIPEEVSLRELICIT